MSVSIKTSAESKSCSPGLDSTGELSREELSSARSLTLLCDETKLEKIDVFIVAVPTPVDESKTPDLSALKHATELVARNLEKNGLVIYESTVFPGATEEICVPIIEKLSGFKLDADFSVGYSPERVNPGDRNKKLTDITKVVSGSNERALREVSELYKEIIDAGVHEAESIRVAEAAKVIENVQRDVNIALVNELAILFDKLEINSKQVLQAARTKWNFLDFKPGLVGGHCIGVDPYYLTYKASTIDFHPEIILSGRRINDRMSEFVAGRTIKEMVSKNIEVVGAEILILGFAFKSNCPDTRNTKVTQLYAALSSFSCHVSIYDPVVGSLRPDETHGIKLIQEPLIGKYDAVVLAVDHDCFKNLGYEGIHQFGKQNYVLVDVKQMLPSEFCDFQL